MRVFILWCALLPVLAVSSVADGPTEFDVKAAFVYNFAKFTEWPTASMVEDDSAFVIGILGTSNISNRLKELVADKDVRGRSIEIVEIRDTAAIRGCHILVVGDGFKKDMGWIRKDARKRHILTIADWDSFSEQGGMVYLYVAENRVRFRICTTEAASAGLTLSAKLLRLAEIDCGK